MCQGGISVSPGLQQDFASHCFGYKDMSASAIFPNNILGQSLMSQREKRICFILRQLWHIENENLNNLVEIITSGSVSSVLATALSDLIVHLHDCMQEVSEENDKHFQTLLLA